MSVSHSSRGRRSVVPAGLAVVWLSAGAAVAGAQPPLGATETAAEAAHRALSQYLDSVEDGLFQKWNMQTLPRLCELWLNYARAAGLPERPKEYRQLRRSIPPDLLPSGGANSYEDVATIALLVFNYDCPPPAGQAGSEIAVRPAATAKKDGIGSKAVLIGGGAAALGAAVALAGGSDSGSTSTPPATPPVNVTPFHGLYVGRLVTNSPSIPGCGRAATAACNAQVGGSATGTPASLSFGGDLPSTGILRPTGGMEGFRYEGPANGLAATAGGITLVWLQHGTIANNVLTLDGTATVTSPGPCNGAVITTRVEATKN